MRKITHEEYVIRLSRCNSNLEVVGRYINADTKISHRCKKHNVIWTISPSNALRGQGCEYCKIEKITNAHLKSHEQYICELNNKNPFVEALEKYIDSCTAILHKCKLCGRVWSVKPADALSGRGCILCGYKRTGDALRRTHSQYVQELYQINSNIEAIEEYVNTDTPIKHHCKICDNIWDAKPNHTLSGHGCQMCAAKINGKNLRKSRQQYVEELAQVNAYIELVDEYINDYTPIRHQCKQCGYMWSLNPNHALRGYGCPQCHESVGERQVRQWLEQHKMIFTPQKRFDDCKDKYSLPFDFYLDAHNICIEYQGQQHYQPINFGGIGDDKAIMNFEATRYHDQIKEDYCVLMGIKLICIPYWEDVNKSLDENLLI